MRSNPVTITNGAPGGVESSTTTPFASRGTGVVKEKRGGAASRPPTAVVVERSSASPTRTRTVSAADVSPPNALAVRSRRVAPSARRPRRLSGTAKVAWSPG